MDIVAEDVVYLTRHGARIDSDDSEWLKKCNHNRSDDPHLSPSGHIAAKELAKRLRKRYRIITSNISYLLPTLDVSRQQMQLQKNWIYKSKLNLVLPK